MPTNGFLPNSTGVGATVLSDADYAASDALAQGAQVGELPPQYYNKVNRQATVMASMLGQFIVDKANADANDSQTIATIEANFITALNKVISDSYADTSTSPIGAAKALFNVSRLTNNTRVSMSAAAAGTFVTGMTGLTYTKKSPTSRLIVWSNFTVYTPVVVGVGNSAVTQRLVVGAGYDEASVSSGFLLPGGSNPPFTIGSNPIFFIDNLAAGNQSVSLMFKRDDNLPWTSIFNPNNTDVSGLPTTPTAKFIFAEVEP